MITIFKRLLAVSFIFVLCLVASTHRINAQSCQEECLEINGPGATYCYSLPYCSVADSQVTGKINRPPGVQAFICKFTPLNCNVQSFSEDIAIIFFISRMILLVTVIAGVWTLIMFIIAGYTYISSAGDTGAHVKVRNQITNGFVGIMFIILSYTATGLVGLIIFGDAGYILNPQIEKIL